MIKINEQDTQPGTRYVKPELPKGDFASGEHDLPPTLLALDHQE